MMQDDQDSPMPNGLRGQEDYENEFLSWSTRDPEQKIGFRGGRFTNVNTFCVLTIGLSFTVIFYVALFLLQNTYLYYTFCERGMVPYFIALLFFCSLAILILKKYKLNLQRKALDIAIIPDSREYVLSPRSVEEVTHRITTACDDPKKFLLLNRITIALANLKNIGRVSDVDEILHIQAEQDESTMETSYLLVSSLVWAIPVMGFIGTVLGLSSAIGGFGSVLSSTEEVSELKNALKEVTGGLSVAFETTLQGLVCALLIQLLLTFMKKSEEEFLDNCSEYCVRNVVGRLRMNPVEDEK